MGANTGRKSWPTRPVIRPERKSAPRKIATADSSGALPVGTTTDVAITLIAQPNRLRKVRVNEIGM